MMLMKVDMKSLILGLVIGIVVILAFGAGSRTANPSQYRVSIAANVRDVFYAKIHTGTGEVETWQRPVSSVPTKRR